MAWSTTENIFNMILKFFYNLENWFSGSVKKVDKSTYILLDKQWLRI